jgi:uncharacterized protein YaiI (UPF0178 family)
MLDIYIDADACPVKEETYRVAKRHDLQVYVVSNSWMQTPERGRVTLVEVDDGFDAADDWIAERATTGDIVLTADIPLAARCLGRGAEVLGFKGRAFDAESIGAALASRELMSHLREMGENTGGPAPLQKRDRSEFLNLLEQVIQKLKRRKA